MTTFDYIQCEEIYREEMNYIFCITAELPCATYIGNGEWVSTDGKHFIVVD